MSRAETAERPRQQGTPWAQLGPQPWRRVDYEHKHMHEDASMW
jgi:hypothetical protein